MTPNLDPFRIHCSNITTLLELFVADIIKIQLNEVSTVTNATIVRFKSLLFQAY